MRRDKLEIFEVFIRKGRQIEWSIGEIDPFPRFQIGPTATRPCDLNAERPGRGFADNAFELPVVEQYPVTRADGVKNFGECTANPCGLEAVYFGFDSPKIEDDAAEQLRGVAECIKGQGKLVYLEAHADARGTEEYNIMLTDKRGQSVKSFLADLGVEGDNMQVISKGDLEATGTDEASWQKDRRVEFVWP